MAAMGYRIAATIKAVGSLRIQVQARIRGVFFVAGGGT
jgi:hypothetical protein